MKYEYNGHKLTAKQFVFYVLTGSGSYRNCTDVLRAIELFQHEMDARGSETDEYVYVSLESMQYGEWYCSVNDGDSIVTVSGMGKTTHIVYSVLAEYLSKHPR